MIELPASELARIDRLLAGGQRRLLGLVGAPGSGKSTLAQALLDALPPGRAQVVPMDGFHLANVELRRLGRADRKGAPDTFDSAGYVALLRRLREQREEIVYAPEFRREIEEPIAGAIAVLPQTQLVITEGNYLLLDEGAWAGAAPLLDEAWYVDVDDELRRERLIRRHEQFGRSRDAAIAWVENTDEPNARRIAATRSRAQHVIRIDD
ncbi:nucleoside/nucleotide kinase family protein [Variovorax sp. Sphag1AA]|uniref:nucleoside/nucleotide kinase family protein n=1 Tax=Variovorax sp. Sphag1AA TaxID=2587027 RepID=UPI00161EB88B|nr:nucleoside/nucleotide kinase family protein [Variovorax sp. Sphag1AA]MBB3180054.1 pantothenate kinase [Variovorax sp. Sphag1AA]